MTPKVFVIYPPQGRRKHISRQTGKGKSSTQKVDLNGICDRSLEGVYIPITLGFQPPLKQWVLI